LTVEQYVASQAAAELQGALTDTLTLLDSAAEAARTEARANGATAESILAAAKAVMA